MAEASRKYGPTGWAVFAGTVLAVVGGINIIYGLAALFRDNVVTVGGRGLIVWDLSTWGWLLLIFGILQFAVGLALFSAANWARWTAIVLAGLNAIANVGFITTFPLWTILIVALDVIVIYQLSARWAPAEEYVWKGAGDPRGEPGGGPSAARDAMTRTKTGLE